MLPAKLRAWAKCGAWRAPQRACPPCWLGRSPPVPFGSVPVLQGALRPSPLGLRRGRERTREGPRLGVAWEERRTDTHILTLREDGSHGLDLSFKTHLLGASFSSLPGALP